MSKEQCFPSSLSKEEQLVMAIERIKGHGLQVNRDTTHEEPTIGTCKCGWSMRYRTREQVRAAYRQHLMTLRSEHAPVSETMIDHMEKISEAPTASEVTTTLHDMVRDDLN